MLISTFPLLVSLRSRAHSSRSPLSTALLPLELGQSVSLVTSMSRQHVDDGGSDSSDADVQHHHHATGHRFGAGDIVFIKVTASGGAYPWWPAQILSRSHPLAEPAWFDHQPPDMNVLCGCYGTLVPMWAQTRSLRSWSDHEIGANEQKDPVYMAAAAQAESKANFWQLYKAANAPELARTFWDIASPRIFNIEDRRKFYRRYIVFLSKQKGSHPALLPVFAEKKVSDAFAIFTIVEMLGSFKRLEAPSASSPTWPTITFLPLWMEAQRNFSLAYRIRDYYVDNLLPFALYMAENSKNLDKALNDKDVPEGQMVYMVNCLCGHFHRQHRREKELCKTCDRKGDLVQCSCCASWCHIRCMLENNILASKSKLRDSKFQFICWACLGGFVEQIPSDRAIRIPASLRRALEGEVTGFDGAGAAGEDGEDGVQEHGTVGNGGAESPPKKRRMENGQGSAPGQQQQQQQLLQQQGGQSAGAHGATSRKPPTGRQTHAPGSSEEEGNGGSGGDEFDSQNDDDGSLHDGAEFGSEAAAVESAIAAATMSPADLIAMGKFMWMMDGPKSRLQCTIMRTVHDLSKRAAAAGTTFGAEAVAVRR